MALTKAQITKRLYEEIGLNQREAKDIVEDFFEEVRAALESGQSVTLPGFGRFDLHDKKERPEAGTRRLEKRRSSPPEGWLLLSWGSSCVKG